jgi:aminoglycoside 3-N-acetyltransferase
MTKENLKQDLRADLGRLGVRAGDLLMLHASLRKIGLGRGDVGPGGAESLLDALEAAVGPTGTLMMVLGTDYPMDWVYDHPPEARAGLLEGSPPLDPAKAPVLPEVGWLAEAFRRRPGTLVSDNPSGRFGARGPRAEALLADHPWHDYYGPGSPLDKLCRWNGRILRLGADPETVTALHYAEYLADLPDKKRVRWDYIVAGPDGAPRHAWIDCLDDLGGIADWDGEDYFAVILRAYLGLGRHRDGQIGKARGELIAADDIVEFGARWMEDNLAAPA